RTQLHARRAARHGIGRDVHGPRSAVLRDVHGTGARPCRHRVDGVVLAVGRADHAPPRRSTRLHRARGRAMTARSLLLAAGALWVGATLLLSELRWFARVPLADRLRPYGPGGMGRRSS